MQKAAELLFELLSIQSTSREEGPLVRFLEKKLERLGLSYSLQHLEEDSFNIIVNDIKEPDLLISAHLDTIEILELPAKIGESVVSGTGAVDVKASIAAILLAVEEFGLPENVSLAFLAQEESTGAGSLKYLENYRPKKVLVMEPTELRIALSGNGFIELRVRTEGFAGHPDSKRAEEESAVFCMVKVLMRIKETVPSHVVVTGIESSTFESYMTPDRCDALLEIGVPPGTSCAELISLLLREVDDAQLSVEDCSEPFMTNDEEFKKLLSEAYIRAFGHAPEFFTMRAWTDANNFAAAGIPSAIFGPGTLEVAHSYEEAVSVEDVVRASKFLKELMSIVSHQLS